MGRMLHSTFASISLVTNAEYWRYSENTPLASLPGADIQADEWLHIC
ncbi:MULTISPECIES: hypothetical protein [Paenibacillus]|nr:MULTISPECIES: hypothetical protein [Paenibacillus]WJH28551.1 hypothetical protein N6H13_26660 [Paenibacillus sp. CC-CFT742]